MELIGKRIEYSDSYIENLIKDYNEKLFRNENEVLEAILGYQVEDECLSDKNLTKFTRDICEELGLFLEKVQLNPIKISNLLLINIKNRL